MFTYSGLVLNDGNVLHAVAETIAAGENPKDPAVIERRGIKPDLSKRGTIRTVYDGRYKFSRYFSPLDHNSPKDIAELYLWNDVELFDLEEDPGETKNLAADKEANRELIIAMSAKLETIIKTEIGVDDGRELPKIPLVNWTIDRVDL